MKSTHHAAALFLLFGLVCSASGEGVRFGTDFDSAVDRAKKDGKLVLAHFTQKGSPGCVKLAQEVFPDAGVGQLTGKKFFAVKIAIEEGKNPELFRRFGVRTVPTLLVLDGQGEELLQAQNLNLNEFTSFLETAVELQAGLDAMTKLKKDNPAGMSAALKKIGAVASPKSKRALMEAAENESLPDSVRRVALDGIGKQKEPATDLVAFLGNKSQTLRTTAFNSLKAMGIAAMPALLTGLDGYSAEQRAGCYALAYVHTKNAKIAKDATFWRTGKDEAREAALKGWKEWWEKNKP